LSRSGGAIPLTLMAGAILLAACVEIPTGANEILSVQFNPLPSPSVVVGDSLRDTLGIVRPVTLSAYNYSGDLVENPQVKFSTVDRGLHVDSLTGIVRGDSVRSSARIFASLKQLTAIATIAVTQRPDSVVGSNDRDSLSYSLTDTLNVSNAIGVKVVHKVDSTATAVASYLVSFRIVSPADTTLARLVTEAGARSSIDTTDASGFAGRRIKLDVTKLTALTDSVIVQATVKYRGQNIRGSPARLVLKVKPK
jgi:hypothetical protein